MKPDFICGPLVLLLFFDSDTPIRKKVAVLPAMLSSLSADPA